MSGISCRATNAYAAGHPTPPVRPPSQSTADRRVKALALTPEGERLRGQFWHNLVTDPGPLTPLREADLRALTRLLPGQVRPADRLTTPAAAELPDG